jgi:hypothetical protein
MEPYDESFVATREPASQRAQTTWWIRDGPPFGVVRTTFSSRGHSLRSRPTSASEDTNSDEAVMYGSSIGIDDPAFSSRKKVPQGSRVVEAEQITSTASAHATGGQVEVIG